ncbi:MAG: GreA/GreB family elongation factor [Thiobacillus sp.]
MKTTINENKVTKLTRKGMKELKKSISQLENDRKKAFSELKDIDRTFGHEGRLTRMEKLSEIESIESEINDLKIILANAKLLPSRRNNLHIAIGSVVDLIDPQGHLFRYKIVESVEANPSDGRISNISPIGRILIGKTVKDLIEWTNGKHSTRLRVANIY